jgi:hypothetical protein
VAVPFPYWELRATPVLGTLRPGVDFSFLRYSPPVDATGRLHVLDAEGCTRKDLAPVARGDVVVVWFNRCLWSRLSRGLRREGAVALVGVDRARGPLTPATTFSRPLGIPVLTVTERTARRLIAREGQPIRVRARRDRRAADRHDRPGRAPRLGRLARRHGGRAPRQRPRGGGHRRQRQRRGGAARGRAAAGRRRCGRARRSASPSGPGEELGLFGSRTYVRTLADADRRRLAAYLNLDMVGSPNGVPEFYADRPVLAEPLRRLLPDAKRIPVEVLSDHDPFRRRGVPGRRPVHRSDRARPGRDARDPCYHLPCDASRQCRHAPRGADGGTAEAALLDIAR